VFSIAVYWKTLVLSSLDLPVAQSIPSLDYFGSNLDSISAAGVMD